MSVPLPAIFVETVTDPGLPASEIITASDSCCLAFNILHLIFLDLKIFDKNSDFSIVVVPTNTGTLSLFNSSILFATAFHFAFSVIKI